jgi:PBP1b-binding outer membrane lipoprotein LpoB
MRVIKSLSAVAMVLLGVVGCSDEPTKEVAHNAAVTFKVIARSGEGDSLIMADSEQIRSRIDSAFVHVSSLLLALPSGVSAQSVVALNSTNARVRADTNGVRVVGPFIFNWVQIF